MEMISALSNQICSICQSDFRVRQFVVGTVCGHGFHQNFFTRLILNGAYKSENVRCPNCRFSLIVSGTELDPDHNHGVSNTVIDEDQPTHERLPYVSLGLPETQTATTKQQFIAYLDLECRLISRLLHP